MNKKCPKFMIALSFLIIVSQLVWTIFFQNQSTYYLITLDDPQAKCLDGSNSTFYYLKGEGEGVNKYLLFFAGGSWIGGDNYQEVLESAYQRSFSILGSSSQLPRENNELNGIFLREEDKNPYFYNWNTIYINYCDGTEFLILGHQGYKKEPIRYKDRDLYFRGEQNTKAIFNKLILEYGLDKAQTVLVSGCSAGGLAVFNWIQYIKNLLPDQVLVLGAPDSGIFLDLAPINKVETSYSDYYFKQFSQISNIEVDPPNNQCVENHLTEKYKCLMAQYLLDYIDVPLFFVQSQQDAWAISNILRIACANSGTLMGCKKDEIIQIEKHGQQNKQVMNKFIVKTPNSSGWSPVCIDHWYFIEKQNKYSYLHSNKFTDLSYTTIIGGTQENIENTLARWVKDQKQITQNFDNVQWPLNFGCYILRHDKFNPYFVFS